MSITLRRYNVNLPNDRVLDYLKKLPGKFFKILPIYEGRDFYTKEITIDAIQAHKDYLKYLDSLILDISGAYLLLPENSKMFEMLTILKGLTTVEIGEHDKLKPQVFKCVDSCKQILNDTIVEIQDNNNQ